MKKTEEKLTDIPLEIRAEKALIKAVSKAIADHKKAGHPIIIWRDNKVVKIPADQIEIRESMADYRVLDKNEK